MNLQSMLDSLKNFDWTLKSVFKASLMLIVIVIAFAIILAILGMVLRGASGFLGFDRYGDGYSKNYGLVEEFRGAFDEVAELGFSGGVATKMAASSDAMIAPEPPFFSGGGEDAEEFERRSYNAYYETRNVTRVCDEVEALKPLEHVVFDNSNKSEDYCNHRFRVEVEHEDEIVEKLKNLNPRDFDISINTLEESIEYHDSELAVLERRLESITKTLTEAEVAYDGLIRRATNQGDVGNLSTIINNKINTLERLTQQQLNYQERIDRLSRGKGDVEEQVEYAHFSVSISKRVVVDFENITDAWRENASELFWKINETLLALTLGLVALIFAGLQFIVYAVVIVLGLTVLARFLWVGVKKIWRWKRSPRNEINQQNNY